MQYHTNNSTFHLASNHEGLITEEGTIELAAIKEKIKQVIYETTNIKPEDINDTASFKDDLDLDSLTLLEIAVNIDQEFGLDFPEEEMEQFTCVEVSAKMVMEHMTRMVA